MKELQEERIIKAPVPPYKPLEDDGTVIVPAEQATEQCFRIYSVSVDTANHEVTIEARRISYDFMDGDGEQAGCYTELAVFITLATFRKYPDSGIIFMVVRPTTRDLR